MESFSFGSYEFSKTFKVFMWTVASALVVMGIDAVGMIDASSEYAFLIPIANTALYALKEWVADNSLV